MDPDVVSPRLIPTPVLEKSRSSSPHSLPKSWLTESGKVQLEGDFKKPKILLVDTIADATLFRHWLQKRYETFYVSSNKDAWSVLSQEASSFQLVLSARRNRHIDAFSLLQRLVQANIYVPMLIIMSDETVLSREEETLYEEHDVLRKPVTEALVMQRIQKILELHDGKIRNLAYKKHLEENLAEIQRLRKVASEKESTANEVLSALEAPIVAITGALAKVLATPDLKASSIRSSLEDIMKLMTGDVYRPALERVLTSDMDPVAISLLQEYWHRNDVTDASTGSSINGASGSGMRSRKKSSVFNRGNLSIGDFDVSGLNLWNFNCWEVEQKELRVYLKQIFMCWNTLELSLDEQKLESFLCEVEANYFENPYHCFRHAFDVTQTLFVVLGEIQATSESFTQLEVISMLIAALCHDLGHVGKTNKFLVETSHKYALLYNDKAVLEQYHCSKAFEILLKPQNNILVTLDKATYRECRRMIIECILGTDMAEHFPLMGKLEATSVAEKLPQELLMKTLVHFADISNVAKEWQLAYKWSMLISQEFFAQGDREKDLELNVELFLDRSRSNMETNTCNFIKFVCRKFFVVAAKVFPVLAKHLPQMEANLAQFENLAARSASKTAAKEAKNAKDLE